MVADEDIRLLVKLVKRLNGTVTQNSRELEELKNRPVIKKILGGGGLPRSHAADANAHHPLGRSWPKILSTPGWGPTIINTWQVIPGCTLTETFVDCYLLLDCWATVEDCNASGREARLQFRRDGLECVNTGADQTLVGANARVEDCGQRVSIANHTVLTLSAGSYTVDARMRVSNLAVDITGSQCVFRVTEVPR